MSVFQDWRVNKHSRRIQVMLLLFRLAQASRSISRTLGYLVSSLYRIHSSVFVGAELPVQTRVGTRLIILHGFGLVINGRSEIGNDVILRHNTTIGERQQGGLCPKIGDGVNIGAGAIVLGNISIGSKAIIGAGALVIHDVKPNAKVRGSYAKSYI